MERDPKDPKWLIREAYRIDGITPGECRSIFLDWALSLPEGQETQACLTQLLVQYGQDNPDHPMTQVMREGQAAQTKPKRRGGWRSRPRDESDMS